MALCCSQLCSLSALGSIHVFSLRGKKEADVIFVFTALEDGDVSFGAN